MSLLTQKTVILAKTESQYGTDPNPNVGQHGILTSLPDIRPVFDRHEREFSDWSLSPRRILEPGRHVGISFNVEGIGGGDATTPPDYACLLEACSLAETIGGSYVDYTPETGGTGSVTIYAYRDGLLHKILGVRGNVRMAIAVGKPVIFSFDMQGIYGGAEDTTFPLPATTWTPDTSKSLNDIVEPTTRNGFVYRCTVAGTTHASNEPTWPTTVGQDVEDGTVTWVCNRTYSTLLPPVALGITFTVDSYEAVMTRMEIDLGNELSPARDVHGSKAVVRVEIVDRNPSGTFDPEAVLEATHDFWATAIAGTTMALDSLVGSTAGNKIAITAPALQYDGVEYADRDKILAYNVPFSLMRSSGEDELKIRFT